MFNLIRRISYGVIPRPDRPWEEDPTSNAPNTKRKRRLSFTERHEGDEEEQANKKKARGESSTPSVVDAEGSALVPVPQTDSTEVKEVTQGVDEVHLDEKDDDEVPADEAAPENVPLPEEKDDELEESSTDAVSSPDGEAEEQEDEATDTPAEETTTITVDDASDVASSSGEDAEVPKPVKTVKATEKPVSSTESRPAVEV